MKNNKIYKNIFPQNSSDAPAFFDDVYKTSTRRKKCQADGLFSGRSMVEMLGVLAIIGVLSAGSLKGYSAAMFRHKMNQTIDEATKILQRFEELTCKDWGEDLVIGTSDNYDISAVDFGILEECQKVDRGYYYSCRLPLSSVYMFFFNDVTMNECGVSGYQGEIAFEFTSAKECIAFASVHWEQMLPTDWWNPAGGIRIRNDETYEALYYPSDQKTNSGITQITNLCTQECADGYCEVVLVYRATC